MLLMRLLLERPKKKLYQASRSQEGKKNVTIQFYDAVVASLAWENPFKNAINITLITTFDTFSESGI